VNLLISLVSSLASDGFGAWYCSISSVTFQQPIPVIRWLSVAILLILSLRDNFYSTDIPFPCSLSHFPTSNNLMHVICSQLNWRLPTTVSSSFPF
jgi:hypothetical protein